MKLLELQKKKPEELEKLLQEKKKELFSLQSASLAGEDSLKKKAKVKAAKKEVARIKTLLNNS